MRNKKTALITGASGGLGNALCRQFASAGYRLILSGRNPARLRARAEYLSRVYGVSVCYFAGDLGVKGAARELCARLEARGETVDVLVNNAGLGLGGRFAENTRKAQEELLYVNIHAVTELCRHFLPRMTEQGYGKILNIASLGSLVAGPGNAVYCACKAYVLSLSEALSREARGSGVTVTALCPGAINTGFAKRANMESTLLFNLFVLEPEKVAQAAINAMIRAKPVAVTGKAAKLAAACIRLIPRSSAAVISELFQRPLTRPAQKPRTAATNTAIPLLSQRTDQ
ncbi:MAG: SDR family oxidoreductase [Oscillospiraceae bacterium]|jgi:short-subunit dehydrogenase|nr:SDR family oxidoreductase [Oscillospiraceae bacterium]